jgi:hypothetical protein
MREAFEEERLILATLPPSRRHIRLAHAIVGGVGVVFLIILPFANTPLPPLGAAFPVLVMVMIVNDIITGSFGVNKGIYRNESLDAKSRYWSCYKADLNPSSTSAESTASRNEEYMRCVRTKSTLPMACRRNGRSFLAARVGDFSPL